MKTYLYKLLAVAAALSACSVVSYANETVGTAAEKVSKPLVNKAVKRKPASTEGFALTCYTNIILRRTDDENKGILPGATSYMKEQLAENDFTLIRHNVYGADTLPFKEGDKRRYYYTVKSEFAFADEDSAENASKDSVEWFKINHAPILKKLTFVKEGDLIEVLGCVKTKLTK